MNNYGIYAGIVIQNDDPERIGRVKVYIPGITNTVYENWNATIANKGFSIIENELKDIIDQLQEDLPWASCATNPFGGDSGVLNYKESPETRPRPSNGYVTAPPEDKYTHTSFTPGNYSETSSGTFSIPSVGSHIYVFFKSGDTSYPVYLSANHSKDEWNGIFKEHYPTDYENNRDSSADYSQKHVMNSTKHTFEFIDTDKSEELKLSHFCGSNIQMLNDYTSSFTVGDRLSLVLKNEYYTVELDRFGHTVGKYEEIIDKDVNTTIGGNNTIAITENQNISIGGNQTTTIKGNQTVTIKGNLDITVTGTITITTGSSSITMSPAGVIDIAGPTAINLN